MLLKYTIYFACSHVCAYVRRNYYALFYSPLNRTANTVLDSSAAYYIMNGKRISFAHHLSIKLHTTIAEIVRAPTNKPPHESNLIEAMHFPPIITYLGGWCMDLHVSHIQSNKRSELCKCSVAAGATNEYIM